MAAHDRLDQLEPLLSEALTNLDGHTNQVRRLTTIAEQLVTAAAKQSENISFLLIPAERITGAKNPGRRNSKASYME